MAASAVSDSNFQNEVLNHNGVVLVDFWAPWCAPCRMIAPVIEELSTEMAGKVKVVKLNTDDNQQTASQYGIRGIPTLGVFRNGEMVDSITGVVPKQMIVDKLNYFVAAQNG
jgi:thioredoxin 1